MVLTVVSKYGMVVNPSLTVDVGALIVVAGETVNERDSFRDFP